VEDWSEMIEEEFDLKHLNRITQYIDKHLTGYPKRTLGDDGSFEYFFEDHYVAGPGHVPSPLNKSVETFGLIFLCLSIIPEKEQVRLRIIPEPRGRFNELLRDLKNLIMWSGALTCPHCKARYVYKDTDIVEGTATCNNCAKSFDIP